MKDDIKIKFVVSIPDKLHEEKLNDPDFPINVRTILVVDAINNLRAFVETKRYFNEEHNEWLYDIGNLKSYKLDNGIGVRWDIEGEEVPGPAPVPDPVTDPGPSEPVPTPEPNPQMNDPVLNFMGRVLNTQNVLLTWNANKNGKMDIEFYRPGIDRKFIDGEWVDTKWKHSVEKYVGPIDISDQSEIIWLQSFETVIVRAKVKKKILGVTVSTWYSEPVFLNFIDMYKPLPEPLPEPEPVEDKHESEPIGEPVKENPETPMIDLLIYFVNIDFKLGKYIDVNVDGQWFNFAHLDHHSDEWQIKVEGSRGVVVQVPKPIKDIYFKDEQIQFPGLKFNGYGYMVYKIGAKPEDSKLKKPVTGPDDHKNFWARWFNIYNAHGKIIDQHADLISAQGAISGLDTALINSYAVPDKYNRTGKMALIIGNVGMAELPKQ